MLGALAIDQGELDHLTFGGGQHRIDLPVDRSADAEKTMRPSAMPERNVYLASAHR